MAMLRMLRMLCSSLVFGFMYHAVGYSNSCGGNIVMAHGMGPGMGCGSNGPSCVQNNCVTVQATQSRGKSCCCCAQSADALARHLGLSPLVDVDTMAQTERLCHGAVRTA
eukprot:355739-Chlamydomonas_euryale.AAC.1